MKKFVALLVMILLLFSSVSAESIITFSDIPWLVDDIETIQRLLEAGYIRETTDMVTFTDEKTLFIVEDDSEFIYPGTITGIDEASYGINLIHSVKGKIAGYPLKDLKLTFAYDGEYKLIAIQIDLINGSFDDLKKKLTKVYGEGEEKETLEGAISTIWHGNDKSTVVLFSQNEGLDYTLMYGRLDAVEILSDCLKTNPDDVSGL